MLQLTSCIWLFFSCLSCCLLNSHISNFTSIDFIRNPSSTKFPHEGVLHVNWLLFSYTAWLYYFLTQHDSICNKDKSEKAMKKLIKFFLWFDQKSLFHEVSSWGCPTRQLIWVTVFLHGLTLHAIKIKVRKQWRNW